jgi:hypothetical protein
MEVLNFDDVQQGIQETKGAESSSSIFNQAYELLGQQQFKGDSLQSGNNQAINDAFGTLDLFDSQDVRQPTFKRDGGPTGRTVGETVSDTLKQIPGEFKRQMGEIADVWSHPGEAIADASREASRKWDEISNGLGF